MKHQNLTKVCLSLVLLIILGCSSDLIKKNETENNEISDITEFNGFSPADNTDSLYVEEQFNEEEALLDHILRYYNDALNAQQDGNFGLAETKIDSAAILASEIDLNNITDESLRLRYTTTLASLFREYGVILDVTEEINQEDPMAWLDELSETDPEQLKNGQGSFEDLRIIAQKLALRCDIPIDYNEKVKNSIYYFQTLRRKEMTLWLERSGRYLPMIRQLLEEEDLPHDLAYLSMIESGFSAKAYSRAHAVGLWQFIYSTGRLYGLKRTQWIDERRDPVKSTKAAAQHLKDLYKLFGDWKLVMAAYNSGPQRILRQIQKNEDYEFWDLSLPRETRNYVPSFMAAVIISKAPELFGFENIALEPQFDYDTIEVHPYTSLSVAAKCAETTKEYLRYLNPELRLDRTPTGKEKYVLRIPRGTKEKFLAEFAKIPVETYAPPRASTHVVRRRETLSHISQRYGVSVNSLMAVNNITNPRALSVGRRLRIPGRSTKTSSSSTTRSSSSQKVIPVSPEDTFAYTVRRNDSLWLIAQKFNSNIPTLQAINNMGNRTKLIAGQSLRVPDPQSISGYSQADQPKTVSTTSGKIIYTIQKNDTLYEIAQKYGVTHGEIMRWNEITNHRKIQPGQKIVIYKKQN
ncbi:LysM peptidoglycan-binding domain-containing protein [Candidatus Latescibacterota bacterium]